MSNLVVVGGAAAQLLLTISIIRAFGNQNEKEYPNTEHVIVWNLIELRRNTIHRNGINLYLGNFRHSSKTEKPLIFTRFFSHPWKNSLNLDSMELA